MATNQQAMVAQNLPGNFEMKLTMTNFICPARQETWAVIVTALIMLK